MLALPVLALLAIMLITGIIGIDLGDHWDEPYNIGYVATAIRSQVLLPRYYNYPSVMFWLILASLAPSIPAAMRSETFEISKYVVSEQFLLQTRIVFLVVSSLAVVWVYLLVLAWRKNWKEALLSASLLGLSWEFSYHIRWVTPDGLMTMFAALTMLCLVIALQRPDARMRWLKFAAIAAGLTTGSKYTAALLGLPLMLTLFFTWDRKSLWRGLSLPAAHLMFIMGLTYLISTPGTLLDPINFFSGLALQQRIYSRGHEVHTVNAGPEHFLRMMQYFSTALFSPFALIALIFFVFTLIGIYALIKENRKLALVFLSFPVLYVLYFSMQRVMIIRNLMIVFPFWAILAGHGVFYVWGRINNLPLRRALLGGAAALLAVNIGWLFFAAQTILDRGTDRYRNEFLAYVGDHAETQFYVTPEIAKTLGTEVEAANITVGPPPGGSGIIIYYSLANNKRCVRANRPETFIRVFGPREINYPYYTTWGGDERIIILVAGQPDKAVQCIFRPYDQPDEEASP
jgi:4-amino-4-deoxy-L-arabinose transferase-like glycosyltransferase